MKKNVEELKITYQGFKNPVNENEVAFEIAGLRLAIAGAEQRIKLLEQALLLKNLLQNE